LLVSIPDFAGESEFGYCWTASKSKWRHDGESDSSSSSETGNLWNLNFQYVYRNLWCHESVQFLIVR
jgi:hypothetical protein